MKKWVKGDPAYQAAYDGKTYLFADAQGKRMFDSDPAKYVPALGGDCVVALVKMGKRVSGDIRHSAFHDNRLFLFSNEDAQKMFLAQPAAYANADLALNGQCPVCQVNMNQRVAGKPEIAAFHKGFRYLFPAAEQRQTFLASPEKFVSAAGQGTPAASGSGTRQPAPGSSARPSAGSGSGSR
jgi:YHS domain-containing protein